MHASRLPEGLGFITFWPLSRKLKEKFLCDLPPGRRPFRAVGFLIWSAVPCGTESSLEPMGRRLRLERSGR